MCRACDLGAPVLRAIKYDSDAIDAYTNWLGDGRVRLGYVSPSLGRMGAAWRTVSSYTVVMIVRSVRHRGLRTLLENDNSRFLPPDLADRVRKILTVLILAEDIDWFIDNAMPGWRVHRLSGKRRNEWSVSVSGNWRITFEEEDGRINGLNLEDYH